MRLVTDGTSASTSLAKKIACPKHLVLTSSIRASSGGRVDRQAYSTFVTMFGILIVGGILLFVLLSSRGVFASKNVAMRTLEAHGYENIKVVDHAWLVVGFRGCDMSDAARFTMNATNPAGKPTTVYVCTGVFLKGGTVRVR